MEFREFYLLFVLSLLCLHSRAESSGSVLFIDSSSNQFFRKSSSDHAAKPEFSYTEAASAVSVLLGFAPQSTLTADGSSKLNQILVPNPFQRPRAVFMLQVSGVDEHDISAKDNDIFSSSLTSDIVSGSQNAEIQLTAAEEVSVLSLDEKSEFTSKAISNFASWIGGTYVFEVEAPLFGELTISLANGDTAKLYLSKTADREFISNIINLVNNLRNAIELHKDLSHGIKSPAELLTGSFDGIKVLQKHYGSDSITQHGKQILRVTLSKMYEELQVAYKGQIVGVIVCLGEASEGSSKLSVAFAPQRSARWLAETEAASIDEAIRVALVRRVLAWLTGIILLICTLLGIYFLMYMQVTKDTLLYSNVKLD